jgi:hypothetical protein
MKGKQKETSQVKHLFKSIHCLDCQQVKTCGKLSRDYCCQCYYKNHLRNWTDYLTYEKALSYEKQQRKEHQKNLQQLVKGKTPEDGTNFTDWKKFYQQKSWGINLEEWLREKRVLPVDYHCARQWRENKQHLPEKCGCLEQKAQENFLYFTDCLKKDKERLEKECQCENSSKVRTPYIDSQGEGWIACENCEERIGSAGHHGVIKNRNDPNFWGLNTKKRVLCGFCLGNLIESMPRRKKYLFWEYGKRGYWG